MSWLILVTHRQQRARFFKSNETSFALFVFIVTCFFLNSWFQVHNSRRIQAGGCTKTSPSSDKCSVLEVWGNQVSEEWSVPWRHRICQFVGINMIQQCVFFSESYRCFFFHRLQLVVMFCAVKLSVPLKWGSTCLECLSCVWDWMTRFCSRALVGANPSLSSWRM